MHTSDTQESRPPGAGSFLGSEHRFPLQLLHPHPGLVAPLVHALEAPTLSGLSSVSSEVISFEHSSGLGFLSVASLCLVIVHMSWVPWRGKHVFTVWPQVRHLSPRCLKPAVLRGAPGAPSSSFLDPRSYCSFTDTGRQRKGHSLWSPVALD